MRPTLPAAAVAVAVSLAAAVPATRCADVPGVRGCAEPAHARTRGARTHTQDPPARPEAVAYLPPVPAPVSDPFRPPATPFGPGNRGVELATEAGTAVRAAAGGVVTFAGPVAGVRYVTIQHADRARTTYGPLAEVGVGRGEEVARGQPVGTTSGPLLWTVRLGDAYLDPAVLLAASGHGAAHLVPVPREALGGG